MINVTEEGLINVKLILRLLTQKWVYSGQSQNLRKKFLVVYCRYNVSGNETHM